MKEILEQVIKLARARSAEEDSLRRKDGLHILDTEYLVTPRPCEKKLEEYLESLPQETLEFVAAVMYGGRDYLSRNETAPLQDYLEHLNGRDLADTIYEKTPEYLIAGMKIYEDEINGTTGQFNI